MLSTFGIVLSYLLLALLPFVLYSIFTRELPSEGGLFGRLYRIQPGLFLVSNLFGSIIFVSAGFRVARHFGVLGNSLIGSMKFFIGLPTLVLLVLWIGLLGAAAVKLVIRGRLAWGDK